MLQSQQIAKSIAQKCININGANFIAEKIVIDDIKQLKDIGNYLKNEVDNMCLVLATEFDGKATLEIRISENLVKEKNLNAGNIVREIAKEIDGGGGGQAFSATAGGKNPAGIEAALKKAKAIIAG